MEPISIQLMDPNCKPINACAYTVPRVVVQQLRNRARKLKDWWTLESWKKTIPLNGLPYSHHLQFKKKGIIRVVTTFRKLNVLLKQIMSPISIPTIGIADMIRSMEGFPLLQHWN
jgi:hypothetical protein